MLIEACSGLSVRAPERQICFTKPRLPSNLNEVRIKNLRVADASADFLIHRDGATVKVEVLRKTSNVEIV
jgi:hypothetical protein